MGPNQEEKQILLGRRQSGQGNGLVGQCRLGGEGSLCGSKELTTRQGLGEVRDTMRGNVLLLPCPTGA